MKKKSIIGVLLSTVVLAVGISYSVKNAVQASDTTPVTNTNAVIDYYYQAETERPSFNLEGRKQSLSPLTVNHYVDPASNDGDFYLFKQEQYFDIGNDFVFNPKDHYLNFDFTEWDPDYSHNDLASDEPFRIRRESKNRTINYYYVAEIETPSFRLYENDPKRKSVLTQLTVNHYVDGGHERAYLYMQEQYFNVGSGMKFDPKDHYLNFDFTEWDPGYSHNNLTSDKPFSIGDYAKLGEY